MSTHTKTYALGRILIDIDTNFALKASYAKLIDGNIQHLQNFSPAMAQTEANNRISALKKTLHQEYKDKNLYITSFDLPHGGKAVMGWDHPYAVSAATLTCWFINKDGRVYHWETYVSPQYFDNAQEALHSIANNLVSHDLSDPIPTIPGFSFAGGLLNLHTDMMQEHIRGVFIHEDCWSLEVKTGSGNEYKNYFELFGEDYVAESRREGIHVLRYAYRDIGPFKAQEICIIEPVKTVIEKMEYDFQLYISEAETPIPHPEMYVNLYTEGQQKQSNFPSVEEALSLWDIIVSSLRVRSGAL